MLRLRSRSSVGFIEPCPPSPAIKHDGFGIMARHDGAGVRLVTRNGKSWPSRSMKSKAQTRRPCLCRRTSSNTASPLTSRINERKNGNGVGPPDVLSIGPRRSGLEKQHDKISTDRGLLRPCCWTELHSRRQKSEGRPAHMASLSILTSTRPRRARPRRPLTIACPTSTMAIPIRTMAYSISMLCRLTVRVTPTAT